MVWTDSWLSITNVGCGLICVGAGEEQARKIHARVASGVIERQVGLVRWTRWPTGSSANHRLQEEQDEVVNMSRGDRGGQVIERGKTE